MIANQLKINRVYNRSSCLIITIMGLSEWLLVLSGALTVLYFWMKHHYSFWNRTNVPHIKATSIFGNLREMILMKSSPANHMDKLYNDENAKDQPVVGIYVLNKPALLIRDPEVIKLLLIKDFNKFSNRFAACDPHGDVLGYNNLFFIKNPHWKEMRTKLSPVFTSGKIKQMFSLVEEIGSQLDNYLCNLPIDPKTNSCVRELKEISALYTTDVIASVAYGIQANSIKDPNCDFRRNGRSIFDFTSFRGLEFSTVFFLPQFVKLLRCKIFPAAATKFIRDSITYVMAERIKNGATRNDLIDILVAFKKAAEIDKDKKEFHFKDDAIVAQAAIFFTAGFETTSSTMSFGMYELAKKPEIQKRLRTEIKEALLKDNGKLTYDTINEMEYLNMVIQEVLRLYPPLPFLDRECTLPKGQTEYSLKPFVDFGIPHNMPVYVPMYAIQRDPKYFPNPNAFDPERFSPENKSNVLPGTYMPFGIGPHNCIGERFGIVQAKIGLINFLRNHYLTTCERSHKEMVLNPKALIIQSEGGIYCTLVRDPLI